MNANTSIPTKDAELNVAKGIRVRMVQVVLTLLIQAAILFLTAGQLDWGAAWALIIVGAAILIFNAVVILPKNPELIAERGRIEENAKGWDKLITSLIALIGLMTLVVAGLDKRFEWSPLLPFVLQATALGLYAVGNLVFSWAMASNKFFSGIVRIQDERGHQVATAGPYQFVRHPGYVGYILFTMATPLALGSLWAIIPAIIVTLLMVVRTYLEDNTLLNELDGYRTYVEQVQYRLVPGIW